MGMVHVDVEVSRDGGPGASVRFLVDSGAAYSVLPKPIWQGLALEPTRTMDYESLGLVLNPFERTLRPMRMRLAALMD